MRQRTVSEIVISIHAPREGGDSVTTFDYAHASKISIHAPREGGDLVLVGRISRQQQFQSTPPARGATQLGTPVSCHHSDFNPRPPQGGRLHGRGRRFADFVISIHAPRKGGDYSTPARAALTMSFQSTPPARGATIGVTTSTAMVQEISIHAPRKGGDTSP